MSPCSLALLGATPRLDVDAMQSIALLIAILVVLFAPNSQEIVNAAGATSKEKTGCAFPFAQSGLRVLSSHTASGSR